MKRLQLFGAVFFALAFAVWLGRAESRSDDMFILIGMIGTGGFLAAMVEPRRPWMWGLIIPSGILYVEIGNYIRRSSDPHMGGIGGLCAIAALTIGVASAGAYTGAFVRRRVSPA